MNHAVWRSSQQPWNTYLLPNGLWKSPINLTLSWVFSGAEEPGYCQASACKMLGQTLTRFSDKSDLQIRAVLLCKGYSSSPVISKYVVKQSWLLGFFRVFFSMLENKSSCFTSCSNESQLLRTRSSCHLSPNFCCSSFTGLCAREGILAISCLHANIC